jgi:alanyl-tRNA synthetase
MTIRLYYDNAWQKEFDGTVTLIRDEDDGIWLALDRTAFYPEGGGQPCDRGSLAFSGGQIEIISVQADGDKIIWHQVKPENKGKLPAVGETVHGIIDWERRFDFMQQHTGEHIIASCLYEQTGGFTHGLHIGQETSSIDVTLPDGSMKLDTGKLASIEEMANQRIAQDGNITCSFPDELELASMPLRKDPTVTEQVRVCAIGSYEMVACGGTHLSRTSQVNLVKLLYVQPARGKMRLFFLCGLRAVRHYALCYSSLSQAAEALSAREEEVPLRLSEVMKQAGEARRELAALRRQNTLAKAPRLLEDALVLNDGRRVVMAMLDAHDLPAMEAMASLLVREPRLIALLCVLKDGLHNLLFARSENLDMNMAELMRACGAKGGGRPEFARGAARDSLPWEAAKVMVPHF